MAMVLEFAQTFEGGRARVGSLEFEVTKESIVQATCLPTTGEQWFKKEWLESKQWRRFVSDRKLKVIWKKGLS